jgi:16S rRNA G966 N2-methylase RsmD
LAEGGIIVAEHHFKEDLAEDIAEFKKIDERNYGGKQVTFFSR